MSWRRICLVVVLATALLTLTACSTSLSIASSFRNSTSTMTGRYYYYTGVRAKSIELEVGRSIEVNYSVKATKGTLEFAIVDPSNNVVWEQVFTTDATDTVSFQAAQAGQYKIVLTAKGSRGSYNINWTTP